MTIDLSKYIDTGSPLSTHGSSNGRSYDGAMMKKGKFGEEMVLRWLSDFPDVVEVDDYRQLRLIQKADIDCGIHFIEGDIVLAEIKTDYFLKLGGNVTFEFLRINHTAPPDRACVLGWTARTPAKWILFYAPQEKRVYRFKTENMRSIFQTFTNSLRPERGEWFSSLPQLNMRWVSTDNIKSTLIACLPLSVFPTTFIRSYDVSEYVP